MVAWPLPPGLVAVRLGRRANRFAIEAVASDGRVRRLHLPNSGRMEELLVPGAEGLADLRPGLGRRTEGTLLLVRHRGLWVGVDAHLPNHLFARAARTLEPFAAYPSVAREVAVAGERIDFVLTGPAGEFLVEVKSCNRVDDGVARFPDAPTARGTRHLELLVRQRAAGRRAAVVWVVQRADAERLRPFAEADPAFARAARAAARAGVELYAYRCRVEPTAVVLAEAIPVEVG